jgi:amidase
MAEGRLSSRDLVLFYLDRIARIDKSGPQINSILEVNPDAVYIAEALDLERTTKGPRGPLHGIPVIVKDNIDTGDKMHTSAGSVTLANSYAASDSFVVRQLRAAGAVILAKANMTEFANFMANHMPSGFSSRGGQVLNPYGADFFVGGSSSGSGASVACSFTAAAVGTETSGSILSPASQNSVVGIKPTVGLVSRAGIIPIAHSQDTAGPICRTVVDAAILLGALTGVDECDAATLLSKGRAYRDYTPFLNPAALKGARIGVPRKGYVDELEPEELAVFEQAIAALRAQGAEVVDPVDLISTEADDWSMNVLLYEFKGDLNAYLAGVSQNVPVHTLTDIVAYNAAHADVALKHGQEILVKSEATSGTLTDPEYLLARIHDLRESQKAIDGLLESQRLDALLFAGAWGSDLPARAGYPSITVPAGYSAKGPFGITFTGSAWSEPKLIALAYAYEQATKLRRQPKLD